MTRIRTTHIVILAVAACIAVGSAAGVAKAGTPPPPPPPGSTNTGGGGGTTTSGGGGGGTTTTGGGGGGTTTTGGGGGTGTPVSHPTPPMAAAVVTAATAPRVITVSWKLPKSNVITGVIVRRGAGANCPGTTAAGVGVGTTAKRSSQIDRGVRAGATYCYSVFTSSPYKVSAAAHHKAVVGPPGRASVVVAKPVDGVIQIHWAAAAGATHYILKRQAGSCPTASKGRIIHDTHATQAKDGRAVPGTAYCYAVFAANGTKFVALPAVSQNHSVTIPVAAAPSTGSSSSLLTSSLVKVVGGVALGVLLLAAVAFLAAKLIARAREDDWQYSQSSHRGGARLALGRYEGPALVIPAAIVVVSLVLLIAAALSL